MVSQNETVRQVAYRVTKENGGAKVEVAEVIDEAVDTGAFNGSATPRNSARRALYKVLEYDTLLIKDGKGYLRIRIDALTDAVLVGDAWDVVKWIPSESVGCIICDGPNTSLDEHRNIGKATRITNGQYFETKDIDLEILQEFYRILKPDSYCFLYMPPEAVKSQAIWQQFYNDLARTPFVMIRRPTWNKMKRGMGYRFTMQSEPIVVLGKLAKGNKLPECHDRTITDVLNVPAVRGDKRTPYTDFTPEDEAQWQAAEEKYGGRGEIPREVRKALPGQFHETEKPADLARLLLRVGKRPGWPVVDVFAGSGHAAVVAHEFEMTYVAIEAAGRVVNHCLVPRLTRDGCAPKAIIEVVGNGA